MKKTLITMAALAMASVASAESYTLNTLVGPDSGANAELHGWAQKLDSSHLTQAELPAQVNLDSVTVLSASSGNYYDKDAQTNTIQLAVYMLESDGNETLKGISTNSFTFDSANKWATSTTYTFNFSGVTLDSSTSYVYRYVSKNGATADSYFRVSMSTADRIDGEAFYVKNGTQTWESSYSPYATYTVSTVAAAIPEPATATLSLLALAGLAARRRRK